MAKKVRKKVIPPLDTEEYQNHSSSAKLVAQEQRQQLLSQIAKLRTYVSMLENRLETPKFGQLQLPRSLHNGEVATRHDILDVQMELQRDLYRFAGMQCVKYKGNFVFEMSNTDDISSNNLYAVQILVDNHGRGKLGKWILPMSVDVQEILSRHPIDDLINVRHFLKSCKHHVDCYICRAKQLEELRNFVAGIKNARVSHTIGIAQVELLMLGVKDTESDAVRNITLYLRYNSAEVRPYKLLPDTDDNERPSADLLKRLNKYFKPFLKNDLSSAFQQVNESCVEFLWKPIAVEEKEDNLDTIDESLEDTGFLCAYLNRGKEETKRRQKRSKSNERNERSPSRDDEMETSLRVDGGQCEDDNDVRECKKRDSKKIKPRKHKRSAQTIMESLGTEKKSQDDLKKAKSEVANVKKRNITDEKNKSESKVTSAVSRVRRRKQPKKYQMDAENVQTENNNISSKGENNYSNKRNSPVTKKADGKQPFVKSNDTDSESARSPQRTQKRGKVFTPVDEENKEDYTTSNPKKQKRKARMNASNSTPFTKKLPDKRKFFHVSHISEILG